MESVFLFYFHDFSAVFLLLQSSGCQIYSFYLTAKMNILCCLVLKVTMMKNEIKKKEGKKVKLSGKPPKGHFCS